MKAIATSILLCVTSLGAAAADGGLAFACPSGGDWVGWSLPAKANVETPIFVGNKNTHVATVCNCTQSAPDIDAAVYVDSWQDNAARAGLASGKPVAMQKRGSKVGEDQPGQPPTPSGPGVDPYYLSGSSCTLVGPGAVMLKPYDSRGPKWGMWRLEKQ